MSFFHFDATTAAAAASGQINLENANVDDFGIYGAAAGIGFLSYGQVWEFLGNAGDNFLYNWADPNDITPGNPVYQMKRNAGFSTTSISGPAAEVWTNATAFLGFGWSINSGGSGYLIGDTIEWVGGTHDTPVQATVSTVSGTTITGLTFTHTGDYGILPSDPISSVAITGSGINATFNGNSAFDHRVVWTIGASYGDQEFADFTVSVRKGTGSVIDTANITLDADGS